MWRLYVKRFVVSITFLCFVIFFFQFTHSCSSTTLIFFSSYKNYIAANEAFTQLQQLLISNLNNKNASYHATAALFFYKVIPYLRTQITTYYPSYKEKHIKFHLSSTGWHTHCSDSIGVSIPYALSYILGKDSSEEPIVFHELTHAEEGHTQQTDMLLKQLNNDQITHAKYEEKSQILEYIADAGIPRNKQLLKKASTRYGNFARLAQQVHDTDYRQYSIPHISVIQERYKEKIENSSLSTSDKNRLFRMLNLPINYHPSVEKRYQSFEMQYQGYLDDENLINQKDLPKKAKWFLGI